MISYKAATQAYLVFAPNNVQQTFTAADLLAGTTPGTTSYSKPSPTAGATERFSIIQPTPGGTATDYLRVTVGDFEGSPTSGTRARTKSYCVIGVATAVTDIPSASTVSFTRASVQGEAHDIRSGSLIVYSLSDSTATMTVDLTTGQFVSNLHLIGRTAGGTVADLGTFVEQGSIDVTNAGFFGSNSAFVSGRISPTIYGGFFGPQGKEFGYVVSGTENTMTNPTDIGLLVTAVVVGSR
ncbi:hypothetical protein AB5I39_00605 [Sphingomonas sp. MMS24-J45]|uniref:hypothetical protein n=1 Tax=Sphingomonas sp. MMS24-J45 TaxID=3238806 RepID=UPI00384E1B45